MHIHGSRMIPDAGLYAAAAAEKAAAARRASEVRKKLIRNASKLEGEANARRVSMDDQGANENSGQRQDSGQRPALKKKRTGDQNSAAPISMWA